MIASAHERITGIIDTSADSNKGSRGSHQTVTPAQKLSVAQRAAEYGTTAAMKCFAKNYSELSKQLEKLASVS